MKARTMSSQILPPTSQRNFRVPLERPFEGHHVHNSYLDDSVSTRLVARITEPRLRRLVQKKSSSSIPGPDGIGYQIYKSHASSHHCYQSCIRITNRSALLESRRKETPKIQQTLSIQHSIKALHLIPPKPHRPPHVEE
jgi:hypothetical protein